MFAAAAVVDCLDNHELMVLLLALRLVLELFKDFSVLFFHLVFTDFCSCIFGLSKARLSLKVAPFFNLGMYLICSAFLFLYLILLILYGFLQRILFRF